MEPNTQCKTFVTKLNINHQSIYLKVSWKNDDVDVFRLELYEGERTWWGRFSTEFAEKYRDSVAETKEEYLSNVKESLQDNSDDFLYSFRETIGEPEAATFIWKKKYAGSTATKVHGSVPLKLNAIPEPKETLIDFLLAENKELHQAIADVSDKTNILTEELDKCKQEMEKYVDIKTDLESVLYGKFIQILNAKKRRIQLLEENIQKFTQGENA